MPSRTQPSAPPTCHPERSPAPYLHAIPNAAQRPTYMSPRTQPSALPACHPERSPAPRLHVTPNAAQRPTCMSSRTQRSAPPTCHSERSAAESKNLVAKAHSPPLSSRMRGPIPVTHLSSRPQRRILLPKKPQLLIVLGRYRLARLQAGVQSARRLQPVDILVGIAQ